MASSFSEPFNYPTVPIFNQDYEEGSLTGNNGWVGSTRYIVRKPDGTTEKFVYAQHTVGGAQVETMHNTGGVDLDDTINKIYFFGYLGLRTDVNTNMNKAGAWLSGTINDAGNECICGMQIVGHNNVDTTMCYIQRYSSDTGATSNFAYVSVPSDTLIPFSLIYNRTTQKYESLIWDGVEYCAPANENTTNSQLRPQTLCLYYRQNWNTGRKGYYDNFYVRDAEYTPEKYLKFPRWQKTKYGMRPCY